MIPTDQPVTPRPARASAHNAVRTGARALFVALSLFLFTVQAALAADGRALVVSGVVVLERPASSPSTVIAGTEVERGDLIRTGENGRVQIRFTDGSIVSLQPGTAFRIDEYRFDSGGQRAFYFLLRGALRTITGAIGKRDHDDYRMMTPTATVGVRGTEYVAEQTVCDPRCAPGAREGLRVAVTQGRIVVSTRAAALEVGAGQSAAADSPDAAPRSTEQGPVLPPISHAPETERAPKRTAQAPSPLSERSNERAVSAVASKAAAAAAAETPSRAAVSETDVVGLVYGIDEETLAPGAAVSPNEQRDDSGGLVAVPVAAGPVAAGPVAAGPVAAGPGGESGGESGGDSGGGDSGGPDPGANPPQLSPGLQRLGATRTLLLGASPSTSSDLPAQPVSGQTTLNGSFGLTAFEWCTFGPDCRMIRGTAAIAEAGHDAYTSWGRWTDGTARITSLGGAPVVLSPNHGLHYFVGVPSVSIPTSGVFGYELIGATRATLSDGSFAPGTFAGSAAVAFAPGQPARVGLEGTVSFQNGAYGFATPGGAADPGRSVLRTDANHAFSGLLPATRTGDVPVGCVPGCTADVNGGLFGPDAARLGLGYRIRGTSDGPTISGVGVFEQKAP